MKTLKLSILALALTLAGGNLYSQTPNQGGGPILPSSTTVQPPLTNQTLFRMYLVATSPTAGAACSSVQIGQFDYVHQVAWGCVLPPTSTAGSSTGSWQVLFGGLPSSSLTTVASATSISVNTRYSSVTGSAAISTITTPSTPYVGQRVTLFAATSATWTCATGGNISAAVSAVTAGMAYEFTWNGTAWAPSRAS